MNASPRGLPRLRSLLPFLVLLLAAGATPALAQGRLQLGRAGSGALSSSDPTLEDESHYDLWTYRGRAGETIKVTLSSSDFDAYLTFGRMQDGEFDAMESNDDGAGGTDSRLVITLPEDAEYTIRVNSLEGGETGNYSVLVEEGDPGEVTADAGDALPEPVIIRAGQTLQGELEESDPVMGDQSHYDLYAFRGRRGQQVTITMRSTAFDSYLSVGRIVNGSFSTLESDDDNGGGEDAQVVLTLPRDGEYAIRANSLFENVTGPYSVRLETGAAPPPEEIPTSPIRVGQTVSGELTSSDPQMDDDSHYDIWTFTGRRGDRIAVTMKSSAFDTYLAVGRMEGGSFSGIDSDDDGAGGTDSRVTITLDADGEYAIRANSLFAGASGAYTLKLERAR